jgi:NTE family protein
MPKADLVLEGGGMKGLGLVGAARRLMLDGYTFEWVAGTSAGAVVAAFLAAGANADEVNELMGSLDFSRVPDRPPPGIPLVSEGISLLTHSGAYEGDYIRDFVHGELAKRGVTTFADLRRRARGDDPNLEPFQSYKLVVTATDITHGRMLRLPWDYGLVDLDPDEQLVADAVRASISIPLYFEPVELRNPSTGEKTTLVDGGVPPVHLLEQVVTTAIVGHDQTYLERPCVRRRTIQVDTAAVGVVEFSAPKSVRDEVVANGDAAAAAFLASWDFDAYRRDCRLAPEA